MSKVPPASSWMLDPTAKQLRAIARECSFAGIKEPLENKPSNRWEARRLLNELRTRRLDSKK